MYRQNITTLRGYGRLSGDESLTATAKNAVSNYSISQGVDDFTKLFTGVGGLIVTSKGAKELREIDKENAKLDNEVKLATINLQNSQSGSEKLTAQAILENAKIQQQALLQKAQNVDVGSIRPSNLVLGLGGLLALKLFKVI